MTATAESEDINRDGICQRLEDLNGDGILTPGNVASTVASVTTGENGTAAVALQYPRSYAQWVYMLLDVRVKVSGSEGTDSVDFWLPISVDDLTNQADPPPGAFSPFNFQVGIDDPRSPRTCPLP